MSCDISPLSHETTHRHPLQHETEAHTVEHRQRLRIGSRPQPSHAINVQLACWYGHARRDIAANWHEIHWISTAVATPLHKLLEGTGGVGVTEVCSGRRVRPT